MKTEDAYAGKFKAGDVVLARKSTVQRPVIFGVVKRIDEGRFVCLEKGYRPQLVTLLGQQVPTLVERRDLDSFYLSELSELAVGVHEVARGLRELDPRYEPYAVALEKSAQLADR
jgi:hypothetical protein